MIYQIFSTYYEDNCADELRHGPVLSAALGKKTLTSQPTLSRFLTGGMMIPSASSMTLCASCARERRSSVQSYAL
ncbi:MAG: transposase [Lachnospiraceae bacterium]|nr:transposase [Lachnospiraceae bacterium]MDE7202196.1 transposase [Lachnospiraceae bacterium]